MNESGASKLMKSEFTIGGEGAAMAGPVGRSATAETDAYMRAEILSYSRTRGLFAGLVLKGTTLRSDDDDNRDVQAKPSKMKTYSRDASRRLRLRSLCSQCLTKIFQR